MNNALAQPVSTSPVTTLPLSVSWVPTAILAAVVIGLFAFDVAAIVTADFDHDEVEHAHVAWMMSQGATPYRDFNQNHLPAVWAINAAWFGSAPPTVGTLIATRVACGVIFLCSLVIGYWILKRALPSLGVPETLLYLSLALGCVVWLQSFRLRPDPLMAFLVTASIACACQLLKAPIRWSLASGLMLGLAASCSTKMVAFCLLIPILSLGHAARQRSWRPLSWGVFTFCGFLVGIAPLLGWLTSADLWTEFLQHTVKNNSALVAPTRRLFLLAVWFGLAGLMALPSTRQALMRWPHQLLTLAYATVLGYVTFAISPVQIAYDAQTMLIPGACLVTWLVMLAAQRLQLSRALTQWACVGAAAVGLMAAQLACHFDEPGTRVGQNELQRLAALVQQQKQTLEAPAVRCFALAPDHPVFCSDATSIYLDWDIGFATYPGVAEWRRSAMQREWQTAFAAMQSAPPAIVVVPQRLQLIREHNVITERSWQQFHRMLASEYEHVPGFPRSQVYRRLKQPAAKRPGPAALK